MELSGKRVLITGATGGLGRAIAGELAGAGAALALSSRKTAELETVASSLPGSGHTILTSDLSEPGAGRRLAAEAGELDVLVANAGLPGTGRLEAFEPEQLERALRVNLEAPIETTHALLPAMLDRGSGHFVYVSSLAGKAPSPRSSVYNATKFGLRGFALAFRQDLRGSGVGASLVLPGFIRDAGMFADSGAKPPPGMGTGTPEGVGAAVRSAIERNRAEVVVAPPQQRAIAYLGQALPSLAALAQRGRGERVAERLTEGQREKR
jgi:short-subunit dehydrogenase